MDEGKMPRWLALAREIQSLSQTGLTYSENNFNTQRYQRLMEIAAEIVQNKTELETEPVLRGFLAQPGYATVKVDVRGAVVRDGKILLVQERSDQNWCMPGGWADIGDLPSEMVVREVLEESGFHVVPRKVVGVFDANRSGRPLEFYHAYKIIFLCELCGGEARTSYETMAVGFFDLNAPPPLSTARTNRRHLAEIGAHLEEQGRPTAFD